MKFPTVRYLNLWTMVCGQSDFALAIDPAKMLDLQVGNERLTGRVLKHNDKTCLFLGRDGRLRQFPTSSVATFTEISDEFKPFTANEVKHQLQGEFGKQMEVRSSNHYVVIARPGSAEKYTAVMEQIYREFVRSFRARGFRLNEPDFPMVAIVFPDQGGFTRYCQDEKSRLQPGMVGYYLTTSNRVAMFERQNQDEIDQTVIHEATHQVAFNTGIHSRLGKHPRWVVEGLAMAFEAEGVRSRQGTTSPAERVNRERFLWFQEYLDARRPSASLEPFLASDDLFEKNILDAYSEAWALSFFLIETRPTNYARYLKRLVDRDPFVPYDAAARVKDFCDSFGKDLSSFEVTYLKFIRRLADR